MIKILKYNQYEAAKMISHLALLRVSPKAGENEVFFEIQEKEGLYKGSLLNVTQGDKVFLQEGWAEKGKGGTHSSRQSSLLRLRGGKRG